MEKSYIKEQLIDILCKDFQSLWIINLEDMSPTIFKSSQRKVATGSVEGALKFEKYDDVRIWYIEHYVVESYRKRLLERTEMNYVLSKLDGTDPFVIEYGRLDNGEINFNQLYYDKIVNPESGKAEAVIMGFRDIDLSKNVEVDSLTGTMTRQIFFKKSEEWMWQYPNQSFDIVMSDIVDFKKINEVYGVKAADEILRWVGKYISHTLPKNILVGRFGGDQIVAFGPHDIMKKYFSDSCLEAFQKAEKENGLPPFSIKFGVYANIKHNHPVISSCDKAHMALNSIKQQYDKIYAYYDEEIMQQVEKKRRIEKSMHDSLKNREFKVYYQPKHDAKTGKLVGAEALIRWIHPEYGFMSPADFIPLFEMNGFIVENDRYVWERTCENLKKWEQMGLNTVPVSINASKLTMMDNEVVEHMKDSAREYGISPEMLHIEITETLMTENVPELVNKLNQIRNMGFMVELDDFGSGYSSFDALSVLPIDVIKLDMTFMQQFGDRKRIKILEACINLAKELGLKTVSEGVELTEQKELLSDLGVDAIQGYYFSKPLPVEEFEKYLQKYA